MNAILGSKINFKKEGLGFIPTIKKKYDVKTVTFVSQQSTTKTNPLIKMNYSITEKPILIPTIEVNLKEKGKEKVGENKKDHIIFNKNSKIIKLGMNQNQNKSMNNQIKKVA